MKNKAEVVIRL